MLKNFFLSEKMLLNKILRAKLLILNTENTQNTESIFQYLHEKCFFLMK